MEQTALLFKAMSDQTRLRILALLTRGELCVCEIEEALNLPQSTVSRHLAFLKNAGLVSGRRRGVWMYYRLQDPGGRLHQAVMTLVREQLIQLPEIDEFLKTVILRDRRGQSTYCCEQEQSPWNL